MMPPAGVNVTLRAGMAYPKRDGAPYLGMMTVPIKAPMRGKREAMRGSRDDTGAMNARPDHSDFVTRQPSRDWPRALLDTCRRIEAAEREPTLESLANAAGVGAAELQRQFRARLGSSPKEYARARKLHRLSSVLHRGRNVLDATLEAGFESPTRAWASANEAFGVPPGKLRDIETLGTWLGLSELGWMLMAASERGVCWLAFGDAPEPLLEELRKAHPKAQLVDDEARLRAWFEQVREHLLLPRQSLDLPTDVRGTAFQSRVWQALREIPLGQTRSYGALANELGAPKSVRAVASACARNRVALVIPCHRVIGGDGGLAGYRWGVERKRRVLADEATAPG
jgi:AraC family transcriptional regulator of adaptative response/methylated-DNA-[protein]-cysteine methyltransferase